MGIVFCHLSGFYLFILLILFILRNYDINKIETNSFRWIIVMKRSFLSSSKDLCINTSCRFLKCLILEAYLHIMQHSFIFLILWQKAKVTYWDKIINCYGLPFSYRHCQDDSFTYINLEDEYKNISTTTFYNILWLI